MKKTLLLICISVFSLVSNAANYIKCEVEVVKDGIVLSTKNKYKFNPKFNLFMANGSHVTDSINLYSADYKNWMNIKYSTYVNSENSSYPGKRVIGLLLFDTISTINEKTNRESFMTHLTVTNIDNASKAFTISDVPQKNSVSSVIVECNE